MMTGCFKMSRCRVHPVLDNMARHVAVAASLPLGYAWLPVSCCCAMPTVTYGMQVQDTTSKTQDGMDMFSLNFGGMVMGIFSCITCACCLGCCGTRSPNDIYG